nr:retrovirus-related Pol polyprotein from transposon TNT 1-94 [Tanacetum cinerariifolium]
MLEHQRLAASLEELPATIIVAYDNVIRKKAFNTLILCLGDWSYKRSSRRPNTAGIWKKLETLYMTKSLANHLYLKKMLYTLYMHPGKSQSKHIDEFHKLMTKAKGDGGEGLYVRGKSGQIEIEQGIKRANCVYTVDGQAVTKKTLNGRKQFGEYHTG